MPATTKISPSSRRPSTGVPNRFSSFDRTVWLGAPARFDMTDNGRYEAVIPNRFLHRGGLVRWSVGNDESGCSC